ncbi:Glycine cleavage system transcriptional activator [Falsiruegeria litorea R37]|uniref:Glycine cleavage system transcriptional activator n=1 Tax=Falsiruegeria litorea R37 TaxID=1200284 RepID=A0A1Y5T540_9RHOB|nr:LysR family transcriptional regulator [Falsiruegeria litorea]SLN52506.1 Glycine cleavage system transcriptional activator [Falsiruegeria litorea R37]
MRLDSTINLSWLSAFDAAARHLNFTKAAEELGLSQGAVSIQIQKLERHLNASLFERRGRHIVLTDEGYAYHPHVSDALEGLSSVTTRMFSRHGRNTVSIACFSPTFVDHWLCPLIPQMTKDIPEVELNLMVDYQANYARSQRDDLVISYEAGDAATFVPLAEETLIAVCSPSYLEIHKSDWGRGILIEIAGPRPNWPLWRATTGVQAQLDGRVMQVNSLSAAIRLARCGGGVALAARSFVSQDLRSEALVETCPGRYIKGRTHGFDVRQVEGARPVVKKVARWLIERADQSIPDFF